MTNREIIRQLKALGEAYRGHYAPTPEATERMVAKFQAGIAAYKARDGIKIERPSFPAVAFRILTGLPEIFVPASARMVLKPTAYFAVAALLVFGGISAASGQIMPGHLFYGIKRATERAQLTFAIDPRAKTRLQLELAGRRLDEATSLIEGGAPARDRWLGQTVSDVKNQLSDAQAQLEALPEKDQEAVDVAKYVDRKASTYRRALREATRRSPVSVQNEAEAAGQAADDVSIAAVTRLVREQKNDGLVSVSDVERRVREKLRELEESIQLLALRLSSLSGGPNPEVEALGGPTYGSLVVDLGRAREKLEAGKNLLARGGALAALGGYREGVAITNHLEAALALYEKNATSEETHD